MGRDGVRMYIKFLSNGSQELSQQICSWIKPLFNVHTTSHIEDIKQQILEITLVWTSFTMASCWQFKYCIYYIFIL